MKKPKANITLSVVAELGWGKVWFALRKGLCELRRRSPQKEKKTPIPHGKWEKKLSVILCTKGTCPVLSQAVDAVLNQTIPQNEYEVLVVWNSETEPPKDLFSELVSVVWEKTAGISYARNRGAMSARGEILLYLDDDAVADRTLVAEMIHSFQKHPFTAIVGGQISLKLPQPRPELVLSGREGLWSAYQVPYSRFRKIKEQYAFPYGACFGVRNEVLTALGGFPTDYGRVGEDFGGGEETALCFRVLQKGWEIGIQPKARVEHRVEPWRFSGEHVKRTIRAGILTAYRLSRDGYAPDGWDLAYTKERLAIAAAELEKLKKSGTAWEVFYKQGEYDAFSELAQKLEGTE